MISSKLSSKGQITLPKSVRQALGVQSGDRIQFEMENGAVILRAMGPSTAEALAGSLQRYADNRRGGSGVRKKVRQEVSRAAAKGA